MNKFRTTFICFAVLYFLLLKVFAQGNKTSFTYKSNNLKEINKIFYAGLPNHAELAAKSLDLATSAGFSDTTNITLNEIKERIKAGAYSEDFENIPGIIGEHFPEPWNQGPDFDFNGLYPFSKIPYGSFNDTLSGWFRGLYHGYDPVKSFVWPGAYETTIDWANSIENSFTWNKAIELYKTGKKPEAYECLGHLLHLLEDLSIPAHVKLINHGISINKIRSGTIQEPDLLFLIVDEYELALSGGIKLTNYLPLIPDLLDDFRLALDSAKYQHIPLFNDWKNYMTNLAVYTYNLPAVNKFYDAPSKNGDWGYTKDKDGNYIEPFQYGITPVTKIGDRWTQITLKTTASIEQSSVIPESSMVTICNNLVPKAVEYGAGLILYFLNQVNITKVDNDICNQNQFKLFQNYPNPFNPTTNFEFQIADFGLVTLKVYDILGREVATILNKELPAGNYKYQWDASGLASGIYFYRLKANNFVSTKKLILMK